MSTGVAEQTVAVAGCGLVGLAVGSFLNVVAYRLPRRMSLSAPPSSCPACGARLTLLDLVPVLSWLALRARCRHCGAHISSRYPVVELLAGLVFAGTAAASGGPRWVLPPLLVLAGCAVGAAVLDADGEGVPSAVAAIAAVAAVALLVLAGVLGDVARPAWAGIGAALTAAAGLVAERTRPAGRLRRAALLASLGAAAGALWAGGGPLAAALVVVAAAAAGAGRARHAPFRLLLAGSYAAVLASAAIGRL